MEDKIKDLINKFDGNISLYATDCYNNEIRINENEIVETASCIKVFILIEYYNQIMRGEKSRDDMLIYNYDNDYVENGSGIIQYLESGLNLSSKNMATLMIIVSDNIITCRNDGGIISITIIQQSYGGEISKILYENFKNNNGKFKINNLY